VPILEVHESIIAVPIIGTIDRQRSNTLADQLTRVIVERQPQFVILDLTGAYALDAESAQSLMKVLAAVRLLGSEGMLSGIRGQLAQTIVDLRLDLSKVRTERTLQDAIARCIEFEAEYTDSYAS
jgi:rsbT co-antagonist protein RsbR